MIKHSKSAIILLRFGTLFIMIGLTNIVITTIDYGNVVSYPYVENVESELFSVYKSNSSMCNHDDYSTKEIILRNNNQVIEYYGTYKVYPKERIKHTIISRDGINWKVNDLDTRKILILLVAYCSLTIVGLVLAINSIQKLIEVN